MAFNAYVVIHCFFFLNVFYKKIPQTQCFRSTAVAAGLSTAYNKPD